MARSNAGDPPPNQSLSPFHTPPGGMPLPVPGVPLNYLGQPVPAGPPPRTGPTPLGILNALKRRWVLATLIGGIAASLACVAVWLLLPAGKHQAQSHVRLKLTQADGINRPTEDPESFRRTQVFHLKSRDLINRTLADASVSSLPMIRNSDDPVRFLEEGLKVSMDGPEIISITLTGNEPEDMRVVLDQLVRRYIDDATSTERRGRDEMMRKLEKTAEAFKQEITSRERQIQLMADTYTTTGGEEAAVQAARMQNDLAKLDAEVFTANKELQEIDARLELLRSKLKAERFDFSPEEINQFVDSDIRVSTLINQRLEKSHLLGVEKSRVSPENPNPPTVMAFQNAIDQLDKDIPAMREKVRPEVETYLKTLTKQKFKNDITDLEEKRAVVAKILDSRVGVRRSLEEKVKQIGKGTLNLESLRKELDPLRVVHSKVEERLALLRVDRESEPRVSAHGSAYYTLNKNLKQKILICSAVGLITLIGVLGLVGFLEWRTRRIDSVDQVVTDLGMRVIGTVPAFPNKANLRAAEVAGGANWRFALNESINSTRTMLLHAARSSSMQVVMVTSATQGEGKTSLASQLGTSMATAGMRTLIVDCDLRNPSIHKLFDLGLSNGVSEVLCQEADVTEAVQPTAVPNLWVIPAGQCSNRVINALAQGHPLETLFNRLRGQFDFIIVDSCPVLPVADALLIGQHVDGVLFSIMQDISQLPKVVTASEKLAQLNIPLVGAVVNGIRQNTYSYGYNYVKQLPA